MGLLTINCWWTRTNNFSTTLFPYRASAFMGGKFIHLSDAERVVLSTLHSGFRFDTRAFASRNSVKKLRRNRQPPEIVADIPPTKDDYVQDENSASSFENSVDQNSTIKPSRSTVLQACTITSGLIAALGIILRQVSHVASVEGLPILDCSAEVSYWNWAIQ
nr:uncharacterized protein LOC111988883 isoform X3 [Quercus suber]XP_023898049.1 uncharacterized protein LOC112009924 isoform X3 [Quercus suber]